MSYLWKNKKIWKEKEVIKEAAITQADEIKRFGIKIQKSEK